MTKELAGKIAFVTGSGRGLGRVMADRLAELGADVAIHDLTWTGPAKYGEAADLDAVAKVLGRHGGRVAAVSGNIGDNAAVAKMKEEIEAKLGRVDILVNCAGGDIGAAGGKPDPNDALGIPLEDIRALTENNLYGTILVCQAFVPPMVKAGSGSVINIGSGAVRSHERRHLCGAQGRRHPLYALPRGIGPDRGRSHQCGESRRDQDCALRGDAGRRSEKDGFVDQVAYPLWGAGRDGRRGRLSRWAQKQIHQRAGSSGGRRRNAVSWLRNCLEDKAI